MVVFNSEYYTFGLYGKTIVLHSLKYLTSHTCLFIVVLLSVQLCLSQQPVNAVDWFKKGVTLIDRQQNYTKGIKALDSAMQLNPSRELLIQIKFAKGVALNSQGNLSEAVTTLKENIPLINTCDETQKIKFHANNYRVLGDTYKSKGELLRAMEHYQKALAFSEKYTAPGRAMVLHQIAVLLEEKEEYAEAEKYLHLATDEHLSDHLRLGKYINLGEIYTKTGRLNEAKQHYVKAQKFAEKANNNNALCYIYLGFATVSFENKNYEQAIDYYEKTITLSEKIGSQLVTTSSLLQLAIAYDKTGQYFEALPYLDQAAEFLEKEPSRTYLLHLYNTYALVYEKTGNYEKSIVYLKKAATLKDSIFNTEKNKQFEELKIAYETKKKQQEIELLTLQKKKNELEIFQQEEALKNLSLEKELEASRQQNTILQLQKNTAANENKIALLKKGREIARAEASKSRLLKNAYLIGFVIFSVPLGVLLFVYYQKLKTQKALAAKQKELNQKQVANLVKEQQLKTIRASIEGQERERKRIAQELHDAVGGSLAAVKLQLDHLSGEVPKLSDVIDHLDETYEQVRHISHDLLSKKIQENAFTGLIRNYLQDIASSTSVEINFTFFNEAWVNQTGNDIQAAMYKIIQELINNTIKHAAASAVEIQLNAHADMINLLFEDNGKGFVKKENKKGVGLQNIRERVQSLNGSIAIDSKAGRGTLVNITIPIKKQQNDL